MMGKPVIGGGQCGQFWRHCVLAVLVEMQGKTPRLEGRRGNALS